MLNCNRRMRDKIRALAKILPIAPIKSEKGAMKMNENTKELVAIGASIAAHCQPCLTFHVDKARRLGNGEDEINEAIAVGRMIRKGAMSAMDRFAESVVAAPEDKPSPCCDNAEDGFCDMPRKIDGGNSVDPYPSFSKRNS